MAGKLTEEEAGRPDRASDLEPQCYRVKNYRQAMRELEQIRDLLPPVLGLVVDNHAMFSIIRNAAIEMRKSADALARLVRDQDRDGRP